MKYPKPLKQGDVIGVTAPSSGVTTDLHHVLKHAAENIESLNYGVTVGESVWENTKCVSTNAKARAEEFLDFYNNPEITAIIPPWGGEFLMDMLPYIDFHALALAPPKWISGYSDLTTLLFPMTILSDIATIHGSNFMNMGQSSIPPSDMNCFKAMSTGDGIFQESAPYYGSFTDFGNIKENVYSLDKPSSWKSQRKGSFTITGRMIGGCMDTLTILVGTKYSDVSAFIEKYKEDGFIWTLESCEMNAATIYRSLWQMKECGWFEFCRGVVYGRTAGYTDSRDFTFLDGLENVFSPANIPVIYDADIGHIPPQIQIVNGSVGTLCFSEEKTTLTQKYV